MSEREESSSVRCERVEERKIRLLRGGRGGGGGGAEEEGEAGEEERDFSSYFFFDLLFSFPRDASRLRNGRKVGMKWIRDFS